MDRPDFWAWSLGVYDRNDAAQALIRCQDDAGLNVNILLWCCWHAELYGDAPEALVRKAILGTADTQSEIIEPLRKARRNAKPLLSDDGRALYDQLKAVELQAENLEQTRLGAIADGHSDKLPPSLQEAVTAARRNLATYVRLAGAAKTNGFSVSLLEQVLTSIFEADSPPPATD